MTLRVSPAEIVGIDTSGLLSAHPSWSRVRLGDVARVQNGFAFSASRFSTINGFPLVRIRDVSTSRPSTFYNGDVDPNFVVTQGDLLVGMDGDFRASVWAGPDALLNQRVCRVIPTRPDVYDPRLLAVVLQPYLDAVHERTSSTTVKHLSSRTVADLPLPLPPLAVQRRLVSAVEDAFSLIEATEEALRNARRRLDAVRTSVAQVTLGSTTDTAAEGRAASASGTTRAPRLDDALDRIEAGKSYPGEGRPAGDGEHGVLKVSAMTHGTFRSAENKAVSPDLPIDDRWRVRRGDLLFSRANTTAYVGACVVVPDDHPNLILSDKSLRLVPRDHVDSGWLALALRAPQSRRQIEQLATGTKESMRNISQASLRSLRLAVPSLAEQRRRVEVAEHQLSTAAAAERAVDAGLAKTAALRRAVLRTAFAGRLVLQDPADEPASDLLARIRAGDAAISS